MNALITYQFPQIFQENCEEIKNQLKNAQTQISLLIEDNEKLQNDLNIANTTIQILQNDKQNLNDQITSLINDKNNLISQLNTANSTITSLENDKIQLQNNLTIANANITSLNSQINSLNSQITTLTNDKNKLQNDLNAANTQISNLNTQITKLSSFPAVNDCYFDTSSSEFLLKLGINQNNNVFSIDSIVFRIAHNINGFSIYAGATGNKSIYSIFFKSGITNATSSKDVNGNLYLTLSNATNINSLKKIDRILDQTTISGIDISFINAIKPIYNFLKDFCI